jgi:hypothetical protein
METQGTPWVRSADNRIVYANALRLRLTPHDLGLIFGVQADMPNMPSAVQEEVTVMLSPSYAKIVLAHLAAAVAAFEQEIGPIKLPADAIASEAVRATFANILKAARIK